MYYSKNIAATQGLKSYSLTDPGTWYPGRNIILIQNSILTVDFEI